MFGPIEGSISSRRSSTPLSPLTTPPVSPSEPEITETSQGSSEAKVSKSQSPPIRPIKVILRLNKRSAEEMSDDSGQAAVALCTATTDVTLPTKGVIADIPMPKWREVDWNPHPRSSAFTRRFKEVAPEEKRVLRIATGLHIDRSVVMDPDYKMEKLTRLTYKHQKLLPNPGNSKVNDDEEEKARPIPARRIQISGEKHQVTELYLKEYFAQFCRVKFQKVRKMRLFNAPENWRSLEIQFVTAKEAEFCFKTLKLHPSFPVCIRYIKDSPNMGS